MHGKDDHGILLLLNTIADLISSKTPKDRIPIFFIFIITFIVNIYSTVGTHVD